MTQPIIVTHTAPDLDALTSSYLVKRYIIPTATVRCLPIRDIVDDERYAAIVDAGRVHDPDRLRFDHHQFPGRKASETSATLLVYEYLLGRQRPISHLAPLIDLVTDGDGRDMRAPAYHVSRQLGLHAIRAAMTDRKVADDEIVTLMHQLLGLIDDQLTHSLTVQEMFDCIVAPLAPRVCTIIDAPSSYSYQAFEWGYLLVLFWSTTSDTVAVGLHAAPNGGISCGDIARKMVHVRPELADEIGRWFVHPAGFFAGRGTRKSPDPTPLRCSFDALAEALRVVWMTDYGKEYV